MAIVIILFLSILLIIVYFKLWSLKRMCEGLFFFAMKDHDWEINGDEIEKFIEYSLKKIKG